MIKNTWLHNITQNNLNMNHFLVYFFLTQIKACWLYMWFFFCQGEWEKQPIPVVTSILDKPRYPCEGGAVPTGWPVYADDSGGSEKHGVDIKL